MYQGKPSIKTWMQMRRLLHARSLALEEEEMENQPQPFRRSPQSNKTLEQHQQLPVKEQSTKRDSLNLRVIIRQAQSLDEVMNSPSSKEKKPQLVPICNQGEFFVEPKEINQSVVLEEVSIIAEILEEVNKLQECKGVGINKFEVLLSMEDNHHHDTIILHNFEDPFLRKKSANDDSSNFFEFISPTISTWCNMFCKECRNSSPLVL